MKKNKSKKQGHIIFFSVLLFLILAAFWYFIPVTETIDLDVENADGKEVKAALITDLHSCYYGKDQKGLLKRIDKENPDIVLLGGDIFDDKQGNDNSEIVCNALVSKYPCYYVTGNHEFWSERVDEIKQYLKGIGVHVLAGDTETITIHDITLDISGVDDPTRLRKKEWLDQLDAAYQKTDPTHVKILVTHRPEKVETYEKYDYNIIVAGHAHSGQIRIPFINHGLYSPNQGFNAKYVNGLYELSNGSKLVVSRGLARESTPAPRYFNHPELVILKIH